MGQCGLRILGDPKKSGGASVPHGSQSSEWGSQLSQLKMLSLGAGFLLCVAINREPPHRGSTTLLAGAQQKAEAWRDNAFRLSPPQEWCGSVPQDSVKFGDVKLSRAPEIKSFSHSRGEHRVWMETRETKVVDCFFLVRAH